MLDARFRSLSFATTAVWLATLAALTALAVTSAYWTWAWFAPRSEPAAQAPVSLVAGLDAARGLFGTVRVNRSSAAPGGTAYKLLGVVAASGGEPGYALLKLDGKRAVTVRQGGEVDPGTRVVEVNADHVVLDRSGMRETLALPRQGRNAATVTKHAE